MKKAKTAWGELFVPGVAVLYGIYALIEQTLAELDTKTIIYSVFLSIPVFICAGIAIYLELRSGNQTELSAEQVNQAAKSRNNVLLFLLWAALFALSLHTLGYFIAIFVYLGVFLWALGERPWYKVLLFDLVAVVFIEIVFIKWIGLPLPKGLLEGIL